MDGHDMQDLSLLQFPLDTYKAIESAKFPSNVEIHKNWNDANGFCLGKTGGKASDAGSSYIPFV